MSEAIFVQGLTKAYNGKTVVDHLNLSVKSGTVFSLLGANGAGKTTTIECMLGTKQADSGTVRLLGQDPKEKHRTLFERIGVQFQEGDYHKEIKVSELCEETASLYRKSADWRKLCELFEIGDKAKIAVKSLSGGERQRLFIVLALIPQPELVFLDELTTGLDAKARRGVWKTLEHLKEQGLTIFLTSHFMDEVYALCDEICILKKALPFFVGLWPKQSSYAAVNASRTRICSFRIRRRTHETLFHFSENGAKAQPAGHEYAHLRYCHAACALHHPWHPLRHKARLRRSKLYIFRTVFRSCQCGCDLRERTHGSAACRSGLARDEDSQTAACHAG